MVILNCKAISNKWHKWTLDKILGEKKNDLIKMSHQVTEKKSHKYK